MNEDDLGPVLAEMAVRGATPLAWHCGILAAGLLPLAGTPFTLFVERQRSAEVPYLHLTTRAQRAAVSWDLSGRGAVDAAALLDVASAAARLATRILSNRTHSVMIGNYEARVRNVGWSAGLVGQVPSIHGLMTSSVFKAASASDDRRLAAATAVIEAMESWPFFLYLAHSLPHIPLARSDEFVGRSAGGMYGDTIEEIDWSVGKVIDALRAAGIERNTLVLFTSDNGPWLPFRDHGGSAGPLKQGKGTTWEGGVRTPAIFWWPGTVRPGVVTGIGSALDLLATAASLSGTRVPADRQLDSTDLSATLISSGPSPRNELFYYWDSELRAVRKGNYKAHFITSGAYDDAEPRTVHDPPLLFDLAVDPGERFNIAAQHPEVVAELLKLANTHRDTVVATKPLFDVLLPKPQK